MICLALDTALDACSVAVVEGERVRARRIEPMARGHQERLAPLVAEAMATAGLEFGALGRVAVTLGPGSFTGLRVGLAFARATALALDIPCIGVGTLRALAASIPAPASDLTIAAVDARRGQLYVQAFRDGRPAMTPEALAIDAATDVLSALGADRSTPVAGSGAAMLAGIGSGVSVIDTVDPAVLARLAAARPAGEPPQPLYLRAPDARTLAERAPSKLASA